MQEIWKPIEGNEGLYEVSNFGRVKHFIKDNEKFIKKSLSHGYFNINILIKGIRKNCSVHRLVAQAFIPNPENKEQVNHKNGIKNDNRLDNLEWCTSRENHLHAFRTGLSKITENNHFYTLNPMKGKLGKLHHNSKTVIQYNLQGEFIIEWGSIMDIERELGIARSSISMCCTGKRKTAGGFIWKYS